MKCLSVLTCGVLGFQGRMFLPLLVLIDSFSGAAWFWMTQIKLSKRATRLISLLILGETWILHPSESYVVN